ncbi:hypothetical protein SYNPS1DRAFT_30899 [Syncephalis pseudoplumigaleata]|uniref:F-box domain-containing protein n=1 Tax=Syncephalis pseudoplumigaleata TaxID=1712513 RepID=A0A4P9YVC8_9FUNG|nr:hypothetical protein SYNPS1DRAFT_30899 [Syncephalis pseudoplumigaleata]|eukprot:RKP23362.1 hypothetical protein SYNPS1DRAFT_30899 [Syncephalis pseudoplumigaleata]
MLLRPGCPVQARSLSATRLFGTSSMQPTTFSMLPLELYDYLSTFLDGPELVALVYTHKRIGTFLMQANERWRRLYLRQFPLQDPQEQQWLQWFIGQQDGASDATIAWSQAYCLRWRTTCNLHRGQFTRHPVPLDDDNAAGALEVILATDHRLLVDDRTRRMAVLVTFHPPTFHDADFTFRPAASVSVNRFDYARHGYLEGSDFKLGRHYLMAFENLNSQMLYVYPLGHGVPFQVRCSMMPEDDDDAVSFGLSIATSNRMDVGMHWCMVTLLDTVKDAYRSRVYHPASRRWCSAAIETPNRSLDVRCAAIWRESTASVIIANVVAHPSMHTRRREITLQLWAVSLDAPSAYCAHTEQFPVEEDEIMPDDHCKASVVSLNSDWLLISMASMSALSTVEIFYRPALPNGFPTNPAATSHQLTGGYSWRVKVGRLRTTPPFMLGVDRVGIWADDAQVNIHALADGALLWRCSLNSDVYSSLLGGTLLGSNDGGTALADIHRRTHMPLSLDARYPMCAGRYIADHNKEAGTIALCDFTPYHVN